jgi:hypothetical protein
MTFVRGYRHFEFDHKVICLLKRAILTCRTLSAVVICGPYSIVWSGKQ